MTTEAEIDKFIAANTKRQREMRLSQEIYERTNEAHQRFSNSVIARITKRTACGFDVRVEGNCARLAPYEINQGDLVTMNYNGQSHTYRAGKVTPRPGGAYEVKLLPAPDSTEAPGL